MEHAEFAYTAGMTDAEVEAHLEGAETGVLALARENDAYAVPLAHYYDGDSLYFRVGRRPDSTKWAFVESTATARYVLYGTAATDDPDEIESWSVVVAGRLRELTGEQRERFDTAAINRHFAPIRVFDEAVDEVEIAMLELDVDEVTGRRTTTE